MRITLALAFLSTLLLAGGLFAQGQVSTQQTFTVPPVLPYTNAGALGTDSLGKVISTSGGGTTVSVGTPYVTVAGTKYVAETMWPYTPLLSGSWLASGAAGTGSITTGANGSSLLGAGTATNSVVYYGAAATTSVEMEFRQLIASVWNSGEGASSGAFLWDSTNNLLYACGPAFIPGAPNNGWVWWLATDAYTGSGDPTNSQSVLSQSKTTYSIATQALVHLKLSVSSGTLTCASSGDGGQTFSTIYTHSIGTVSKGGIFTTASNGSTALNVDMTVLSVVVN